MKTEVFANHYYSDKQKIGVSPPPEFDKDLALEMSCNAHDFVEGVIQRDSHPFDSLKFATALSFYNFNKNLNPDQREKFAPVLRDRLTSLALEELAASDPSNPYPTIGVEIETPRKPFKSNRRSLGTLYRPFFDIFDTPRNRANSNNLLDEDSVNYWEFSPHPSYTASVQQRIISELIQGDFIPHLESNTDPIAISENLDAKLVSMHINIGIPESVNLFEMDKKGEMQRLAVALALSYTSPLRIQERKTKNEKFALVKEGAPTVKSVSLFNSPKRLELKAMELRSQFTYRALNTSQALFAALFSYYSLDEFDPELSAIWRNTSQELHQFMSKNHLPIDAENCNYAVAKLAENREEAHKLRKMLKLSARRVRQAIHQNAPEQIRYRQKSR